MANYPLVATNGHKMATKVIPEHDEHLFAIVGRMTNGDNFGNFLRKAAQVRGEMPLARSYVDELVAFVSLRCAYDQPMNHDALRGPRAWPAPSSQTLHG